MKSLIFTDVNNSLIEEYVTDLIDLNAQNFTVMNILHKGVSPNTFVSQTFNFQRLPHKISEFVSLALAQNLQLDIINYETIPAIPNTSGVSPATSAKIAAPTIPVLVGSTSGGTLAAATYFYKITAITAQGETTGSPEASVTTTGSTSSVAISWTAVPGATGYKIYRGTSAGAESVYYSSSTNSYTDTNASSTGGTVPVSNTATGLPTVGTVTIVASQTGGQLQTGTYFYQVTALNSIGETVGSTEVSATINPNVVTGSISLSWVAITGATSYKVYRGTATTAENIYFVTNTNSFVDASPIINLVAIPYSGGVAIGTSLGLDGL